LSFPLLPRSKASLEPFPLFLLGWIGRRKDEIKEFGKEIENMNAGF